MTYYLIKYNIVDLNRIKDLFISMCEDEKDDYLMFYSFFKYIHKQNYSIKKDFEITHNYNLMSYVYIEQCSRESIDSSEKEEYEKQTEIVKKYYPSIFKFTNRKNDLNLYNLFENQNKVIIAYMITRNNYFDDNFIKYNNYDIISYIDIIYKNSFNYTFDYDILNNLLDKYISVNNKQLVQISEIENKFVDFWIDRLKLKTIDDFDKWFDSMFKSQSEDIKYEYDECMTYDNYKNIINYLEKK